MKLDNSPIQLYGGPCDGETRRFDPGTDPQFWAVPNFAQFDPFFHVHRHWYRYDSTTNKAKFIGIATTHGQGQADGHDEPWKNQTPEQP